MADEKSESNGKVSAPWMLNIVTLILIALLGFWGRSLAQDLKDTQNTATVQTAQLSALVALRIEDKERLARIESKIDDLIDSKRNR